MPESAERTRAHEEREKRDDEERPDGSSPPGVRATSALHPDDPPPPPPLKSDGRPAFKRLGSYLATLARGVWRKGEEDEIFFLAGAISFNVLVAFIPLVITVVGVAGIVLRRLGANAQESLLSYVSRTVPEAVNRNLDVGGILETLAAESTGIVSIGALFFLWVATRLVGTLRIVLRDIFDIPEGRTIISGKIFDIKMLLAAGTLFALNVALTLGLRLSASFVAQGLHINPDGIAFLKNATQLWPQLVAFITIWAMFLLIYRYLPPRRIKWSTALVAATFTATIGEALKFGFSWYVTNIARYSAWGSIATFVILVIWLYYTAVVFILGGEVAQVISMQRTRKRQKQRLA